MPCRTAYRLFCLLSLLLSAHAISGAEPHSKPLRLPDSAAPTFTVFGSREGLSDEIWSTVGFGPDGFVWAGSASSLARFDGYRWEELASPPGRSLVRDMATDADGHLWAIFEREGLVRYDGKRWESVGPARFHQRFATIGAGDDAELWVAHGRGVAKLDAGRWIEDPGGDLSALRPVSVTRTRTLFGAPREWLATAEGLWFRESDAASRAWQRFEHPDIEPMLMTDVMRREDGGIEEVWAISYGAGIARIRDDGVRVWRSASGELPTEAIYSAVEARHGGGERSVWFASRAGLLRLRGDRFDLFDRRHGLPSDAVRGIKVHRGAKGVDTLWIATEGGLARATLGDTPWQTVSLHGARENGVFGVLVEPDDRGGERLWVGSAKDGLMMLENDAWRRFLPPEQGERMVRGLWRLPHTDGRERRVLSLVGEPLQEISDDFEFRALPVPWPIMPEAMVNHMLARRVEGRIEWWAATSHAGVFRLRDGAWQAFPTLDDGRSPPALWLADQVDASGRSWLWAADAVGLARFDGERWARVPLEGSGGGEGYRSLLLRSDARGQTLWASSTYRGIVRLDVSDPLQPRLLDAASLPPPPDPTIYSILADRQDRIYVCTNNGVQQLTPLPDASYASRVFRRRDGLVHDECNTNAQFIDRHDRYWVGTLGGLGVFDPDAQARTATRVAAPLRVTALRADGDPLVQAPAGAVRLGAPVQELRVDYSLLTGLRESESRYRTQLLGFDPAPGDWSGEHSRSFSLLPPGDYVFRIEARDFAGTPAEPVEVAISILPRWWQQRWLQAAAVLLLLLLSAAAVRGYNRGLRARQKTLRHQVAERTRDLHDANLRLTELSYLDPLTGIANRRRLIEAMRPAIARAAEQRKPIGLIVADVDHFKQYNDHHGHLAGDAALRAIAAAMQGAMREQDLVARFGGEEFACLMVDADADTVARVAERMRALVEALPPRSVGNVQHSLTISAGALSVVPEAGQTLESLLQLADRALYAAKHAGRNRVSRAA